MIIESNKWWKQKSFLLIQGSELEELMIEDYNVYDIPESFDAREKWPKCSKSLFSVRKESGKSWAFTTILINIMIYFIFFL